MATRSAIGYALPNGKVRAVYCHWDGYPTHQLPILEASYNSVRKVQALIRPGSMSSLRTPQLWNSTYDSATSTYTPSRDPQPLYHHERGDGETPVTSDNPEALWRNHGCEHLYVYRTGYGWFHYELN